MPCAASAGSSSSTTRRYSAATNAWARIADRRQLLLRRHPGRDPAPSLVVDRRFQSGDADHEELVEVRRGDRGELDALQQRLRRVGRFLEHALVERQPGQLAVDEQRPVVREPRVIRRPPPVGSRPGGRRSRRTCRRAPWRPSAPWSCRRCPHLEHPRFLARTRRTSRTFWRCSASRALATRSIAASLLTISRSCRSSAM